MSQQSTKTPYHTPQLRRYGTINTLTQNVGVDEGNPDGAGLAAVPNKTD